MPSLAASFFVVLVALLGGAYQFHFKPIFAALGYGREIKMLNNKHCTLVPELPACEKISLHQPTGIIYAACSGDPPARHLWMPALHFLNASARSQDYVATYDPATGKITRLAFSGFSEPRGYSSHGMDVVPSAANSNELFVYLLNQRPPREEHRAQELFTDASMEVFKTNVGGRTLTHVRTIEDPEVFKSPNDVVGSSDGKSFWFTNDGTHDRHLPLPNPQLFFGARYASVGYCHVDNGCKIAADGLSGSNGITARQGNQDPLFVASATKPEIVVLERQADGTAVLTDVIAVDMLVDNLSMDADGVVWGAGFPRIMELMEHFINSDIKSAVTALRVSINTGRSAFFGEKYTVSKGFEDDGSTVSGATTVLHDSQRGRLFFSSLMGKGISVCEIKKN